MWAVRSGVSHLVRGSYLGNLIVDFLKVLQDIWLWIKQYIMALRHSTSLSINCIDIIGLSIPGD